MNEVLLSIVIHDLWCEECNRSIAILYPEGMFNKIIGMAHVNANMHVARVMDSEPHESN